MFNGHIRQFAKHFENVPAALTALLIITLGASGAARAQGDETAAQPEAGPQTARARLAEAYGGTWRVVLDPDGLRPIDGQAEIGRDGVSLILLAPGGTEHHRSFEIEFGPADTAEGPTGPAGHGGPATIRLKRGLAGDEGPAEAQAVPFIAPRAANGVVLELVDDGEESDGGKALSVALGWAAGPRTHLVIDLDPSSDAARIEGTWHEAGSDNPAEFGKIVWSRTVPEIDDIIVLGDQRTMKYPFSPDGSAAKDAGPASRRLLLHGRNLRDHVASGGAPESSTETISYAFQSGAIAPYDPGLILARAAAEGALVHARTSETPSPGVISVLERRVAALKDLDNLVLVEATLHFGVTPGSKQLSLGSNRRVWPLIFGNHKATLQFGRLDDQVRTVSEGVFYPGDAGAIRLAFNGDMPANSIGLRLLHRPAPEEGQDGAGEEGRIREYVLSAHRLDSLQAGDWPVYQSEPIHFVDPSQPSFAPPADPDALVLEVGDGDLIGARLFDPARAIAEPNVVTARIAGVSEDLGTLWHDALQRVAKCRGETFSGNPLYALEESTEFSEIAIGELLKIYPTAYLAGIFSGAEDMPPDINPSTRVFKGDHAAAILIRDQLIPMLADPANVEPLAALVDNENGEIQALRARALKNGADSEPLIRNYRAFYIRKAVWEESSPAEAAEAFVRPYVANPFYEETQSIIEIELSETLDIKALAARLEISPQEAEEWAISETHKAAKKLQAGLEKAIGRAEEAGDCNLDELLVVAGQDSGPVVARINPRLVKKVTRPGPPPLAHWEADRLARGFVERLHIAGASVRALKQYGAIDDAYKAMALAAVTAGAAYAASGGIGGAAGAAILMAGDVADAAYFGARGLERAIASEEFYEFAQGASIVIGDAVLVEAEAHREGTEMALLGLIAPGASGMLGLRDLRHFKNIKEGKALAKELGSAVFDGLDELSPGQKTQLRAYLEDTLDNISQSGAKNLDEDDVAALRALRDFQDRTATAASSSGSDITVEPPRNFWGIRDEDLPADPFAARPHSLESDPNGPFMGFEERLGRDFANALDTRTLPGPVRNPDEGTILRLEAKDGRVEIPSGAGPVNIDVVPLGRGSFNTAFRIDDDLVARMPGGIKGEPKPNALMADKRGREIFEGAGIDEDAIRLVRKDAEKSITVDQETVIPINDRAIVLYPGDEIEVVENFRHGDLQANLKGRPGGRMTAEEAIAYDRGVRELNRKGLVALDLKPDNFGFEPVSEGAKELRLVVLDPGGIVPIRNGDPEIARRVQSTIDSTEMDKKIAPDWRPGLKRDDIILEFGKDIDVKALNLNDVNEIPFNPMGVAELESGRALASMTDAEAEAYYATLRAGVQ